MGWGALTHASTAACWLSHVAVWEMFLKSGQTIGFVLEDDADLENVDIEAIAQVSARLMIEQDLDLLQVGFIDGTGSKFALKVALWKVLKRFRLTRRRYPELLMNSFALGTHAFLFNRKAAFMLRNLNDPVWLPADAVLMYFAEAQKKPTNASALPECVAP